MLNLEWLKEIEVIKHDFAYEIMAESTRESLFCHHCFKFDVIGHGIKKQLVNDTPMHGKKVVIPLLEKAYVAKEAYYGIWDAGEKKKAQDLYDCWRDGIEDEIKPHFTKLTRAMKNWRTQIFNYFDHPVTNAYTESLNGIIKIMNRNGRGYSFDALRAKILFAEKAHKRESKSIRSLLSDRGDRKYLGMMVDESLNYGVHMPTLIKMEEDGEF